MFAKLLVLFVSVATVVAFKAAPRMSIPYKLNAHKRVSEGLKIDMKDKIVFVGGVADSTGYGWAIAKACAEAGAKVLLGTWPPVMPMFKMNIQRGEFEQDSKLSDGSDMKIEKVNYCI